MNSTNHYHPHPTPLPTPRGHSSQSQPHPKISASHERTKNLLSTPKPHTPRSLDWAARSPICQEPVWNPIPPNSEHDLSPIFPDPYLPKVIVETQLLAWMASKDAKHDTLYGHYIAIEELHGYVSYYLLTHHLRFCFIGSPEFLIYAKEQNPDQTTQAIAKAFLNKVQDHWRTLGWRQGKYLDQMTAIIQRAKSKQQNQSVSKECATRLRILSDLKRDLPPRPTLIKKASQIFKIDRKRMLSPM